MNSYHEDSKYILVLSVTLHSTYPYFSAEPLTISSAHELAPLYHLYNAVKIKKCYLKNTYYYY